MGKKQAESNVSDAIRLELSKLGCKVFRSQVGLFYTKYGELIHVRIKRRIRFTSGIDQMVKRFT